MEPDEKRLEKLVPGLVDSIEAALRRDCVPFWAVIPVTREFLHDVPGDVAELVGRMARDEIAKQVRKYLADHEDSDDGGAL
jgi:hypothetical protein